MGGLFTAQSSRLGLGSGAVVRRSHRFRSVMVLSMSWNPCLFGKSNSKQFQDDAPVCLFVRFFC